MAKSKKPPTPKNPQGSKDKKSVRRFAPPIPTVPQQYQYPQSLPQYKSVDEINAIYNMFLQNYERTRMEGQRAANLKGVDQYINRGFRDPIEQPVAPQFRYPTAPGIGGSSGGSSGGIAGGNDGRKGGPMPPAKPGFGVPPTMPRPSQPSSKPPIYKSPPTGGVFGPQPPINTPRPPQPPISIPVAPKDNFLRGSKASPNLPFSMPDKLPPHVKKFNLGPKKPTLDSFIPRYLRDSRKT